LLNAIRIGDPLRREFVQRELASLVRSLPRKVIDGIPVTPTILCTLKDTCEKANGRKLSELPEPEHSYAAVDIEGDHNFGNFTRDSALRSCPAHDRLALRVGYASLSLPSSVVVQPRSCARVFGCVSAVVMFIKNKPAEKLFNGLRGVVTRFIPCKSEAGEHSSDMMLPCVMFEGFAKPVIVRREQFVISLCGRILVTRKMIPLVLAWVSCNTHPHAYALL
jgi:hypothetical protein